MAIDVKKERRLNDMNALAESIKLGTELRRMDESMPTAEKIADWDGAVEDLGEFYKGEIATLQLDTVKDAGVYKIVDKINNFSFNGWLIVQNSTNESTITRGKQIVFWNGELKYREFDDDVFSAWEKYAYLSDLTPILSDITKLKSNHTTVTGTEGQMAWNATTKKPVWYNGTAWIYADGTEV